MTDEEWLAILAGETPFQGAPTLPSDAIQYQTTGRVGRAIMSDAIAFKNFLKQLLAENGTPLARGTRVLDFGCGWGRVIRAFLPEVDAQNLCGVDAVPQFLDLATLTTGNGVRFERVDQAPPTTLADAGFDLIFAYSVFSHLSEATAGAWITEFSRLLAPRGVLCLTTRPRSHIEAWCDKEWREAAKADHHGSVYARLFADPERDLARYDAGGFVFHPGPNSGLTAEHYGEAVIPEAYVRRHWTGRGLDFKGYYEGYAPARLQPAIVFTKPAV